MAGEDPTGKENDRGIEQKCAQKREEETDKAADADEPGPEGHHQDGGILNRAAGLGTEARAQGSADGEDGREGGKTSDGMGGATNPPGFLSFAPFREEAAEGGCDAGEWDDLSTEMKDAWAELEGSSFWNLSGERLRLFAEWLSRVDPDWQSVGFPQAVKKGDETLGLRSDR